MTEPYKIGFVGTDGRSFLAALETSRAKSDLYLGNYQGVVVRGTPAMEPWARLLKHQWPVGFISTGENTVDSYAKAIIGAFRRGDLDIALVMPEALIFD